MKVSEAMRRGSMLTYQVRGKMQDNQGGFCALGAVMLGGGTIDDTSRVRGGCCPACPALGNGYQLIVHLNDFHEWTREAIADWIEVTFETPVEKPAEKMIPAPEIMAYIGEPVKVEEPVCVR